MVPHKVVVTGLGAITPLGNSAQTFFDGLIAGKNGAVPITKFDASKFRTKFACEVHGFNPEDYMEKKEARKLDLYEQYGIGVAEQAIQDSGLDVTKVNLDKCGVIFGSGIGGLGTFLDEVTAFAKGDGTPRFNPFFITKMICDMAAGLISIRYGFRGVNYAIVSACATSSHTVIEAMRYIRYGLADVIIAGGSEAVVNEVAIGGFNAMRALSERNDDHLTASRPFDKDRDGFVLGEGAAALVLESEEHALARGAKIYCYVAGGGVSADAYHITAPHPEGAGIKLVMRNALADSGIDPSTIDYVNVHGTSTPLGDVAECLAIKDVFGDLAYKLNISSTKSMTGHLLGAAGAIESVASILALQQGKVPPTLNLANPDPEIDSRLNLTPNTMQSRELRAVMSNTFGFGGKNASLIFTRYQA